GATWAACRPPDRGDRAGCAGLARTARGPDRGGRPGRRGGRAVGAEDPGAAAPARGEPARHGAAVAPAARRYPAGADARLRGPGISRRSTVDIRRARGTPLVPDARVVPDRGCTERSAAAPAGG